MDGGPQVKSGTPQKITRQRRRQKISNILTEMLQPLMMRTPLAEEACI